MKTLASTGLVVTLVFLAGIALADGKGADWRKTASDEEKLGKLIKVMPGAANLMFEMGERYKNLYWAAKQGKWEFAKYQAEEMKDLLETLMITRPKRAATAREFIAGVYPRLPQAIRARDWKRFAGEFERMREQCMDCHVKNNHGFIRLPVPRYAPSPVLNMPSPE